jgi:hypothetical protein
MKIILGRIMRFTWERRRAIIAMLAVVALFILYMNSVSLAEPKIAPPGGRAVGALIIPQRGRPPHPFCTATVITSRSGDLLLTAAHCLGRKLGDVMFAPGFYRGAAKFGEWKVTGQYFAAGWYGGNVNRDFAFLTVRGDVQARSGAEQLGYSAPLPRSVRVEGYSPISGPVVCNRRPGDIKVSGLLELVFDCPGYSNASSGAPFLTDINPKTGQGTVVGVIGGYQQGGDISSVSYSSPIGTVLHRLYQRLAESTSPPAS